MQLMQILFERAIDVLFPPSSEHRLVRSLECADIAHDIRPFEIQGATALLRFSDPRVRALIHEAKFHRNERAHKILGGVFKTYIKGHSNLVRARFVPLPLSRKRMRERGFNQMVEILNCARAELDELLVDEQLLTRVRHTSPQTELSRAERLKNVAEAFSVQHPERVRGAHIVLVDDVLTTGATMRAAKAALLPHAPAIVTCIAFAH